MFLSIIIPVFNEKEIIINTLKTIINFLVKKEYPYELIIVDDASTDDTVKIIQDFLKTNSQPIILLKNNINRGKGYAVRKGVLVSRGEYILFTDADLSTPIEELDKLLFFIKNGYDIVIGSRGLKQSQLIRRQVWYREKMGKIFNLLVRILILKGIKDTQCGFKIFKTEVAKKIFLKTKINRFAFDVEVLFIAKKFNYKIKEVAITWKNRYASKVHIIKDSIIMLIDILRIFIYNLLGHYK